MNKELCFILCFVTFAHAKSTAFGYTLYNNDINNSITNAYVISGGHTLPPGYTRQGRDVSVRSTDSSSHRQCESRRLSYERRWALSSKSCLPPGYTETVILTLSERLDPTDSCLLKNITITVVAPVPRLNPRPRSGTFVIDLETNHTDSTNVNVTSITLGRCASLTCNVSYNGSEKEFVLREQNDGKCWLEASVADNDCNTTYYISLGCSWYVKELPSKKYSFLHLLTVRFLNTPFCSSTKSLMSISPVHSTAIDTITRQKASIPSTAFVSATEPTSLSSTVKQYTMLRGNSSFTDKSSQSYTKRSIRGQFRGTELTIRDHSARTLTSGTGTLAVSKPSVTNPTPTHLRKPYNVNRTTVSTIYAFETSGSVKPLRTTNADTITHKPLDTEADTFLSLASTANNSALPPNAIISQQKSKLEGLLQDPAEMVVVSLVAGVITGLPLSVGLYLLRNRCKKPLVAPSARTM